LWFRWYHILCSALCFHRSWCMIIFRFLVSHFICLLTPNSISFVHLEANFCSSEDPYFYHFSDFQIGFFEQLRRIVLHNFFMCTSFQVQKTLLVKNSFQKWL
jgi:hypothetical protein